MSNFNSETLKVHVSMILNAINDNRITNEMVRDNEVHHEVFNTDYFIIGYHEADKWIQEHFDSTFEAIDIVREYETNMFGEFTTELNSEKIANMLSYICGEQALYTLLGSFDSLDELKSECEYYLGLNV